MQIDRMISPIGERAARMDHRRRRGIHLERVIAIHGLDRLFAVVVPIGDEGHANSVVAIFRLHATEAVIVRDLERGEPVWRQKRSPDQSDAKFFKRALPRASLIDRPLLR